MTETRTLLRQYAEEGSELAFQELVERYIDLVYSTALRIVNGDSHAAADISQMVFVRLSQKARHLATEVRNLGGWLHRDTCYVAAVLIRGEQRRRIRERQAVEMNTLNDETDTRLTNVLPILDDAINELGDDDREAIMLRFFEQQSFRALGQNVGSSEDAARMRVNRALEKLHGLLRSRGVAAVSVGALASILGTKAVSAAPIGLAASVVKSIGTGATATGGTSSVAVRTIAKSWKPAVGLTVAALMVILSVGVYVGNRAAENSAKQPPRTSAMQPTNPIVPRTEPKIAAGTPNTPTNVMTFKVIDAASGAPLAGITLDVLYFAGTPDGSASTMSVKKQTDRNGIARIDFPRPPYTYGNIYVTDDGHVSMATQFQNGEQWPADYVLKLPPGAAIGGQVVNEAGQPVPDVKVEVSVLAALLTRREFIDVQTSQSTDANGHWWIDTIPADNNHIRVYFSHSNFVAAATNLPVNTPDATSAVVTLQKGISVTGTVVDFNGQPVPGATVRQLNVTRNILSAPATNLIESAKSDGAGHFELAHINSGAVELSIQAEGLSPVVLRTNASTDPVKLLISLARGRVLRGRVLDQSGTPVTNATVSTQPDWRRTQEIAWTTNTDTEGRFEWDSAPAQALGYAFQADGFSYHGESLPADDTEHAVTLSRWESSGSGLVRVRGTALDADSGQPLDEFKVLFGSGPESMPPVFAFVTEGKDGHFDFQKIPGGTFQVAIEKDGYAPVVSTNLLAKNGDPILAFELHKDSGFNAEVLLPDGTPAANANVFLYQRRDVVGIDATGEIHLQLETAPAHTQTDARGHFSFASVLDPRGFLVIHDGGYADVPLSAFNGKITLQSWGRVQGRLLVGGHPGAGQSVCLADLIFPSYGNGRVEPPLHLWRVTKTDSDGNFAFDKVPPGERLVSQCFTQPNFARETGYYETQEKPVTVNPGSVTQVELGGTGTTVTGQATFATATEPINWKEVVAELRLKIPDALDQPPPRPEDYSTSVLSWNASLGLDEAQRTFWSSSRGREVVRSMRSYAAYCSADGSFSIPDVPPGEYELKIDLRGSVMFGPNVYNAREVGLLEKEISVPESEDGKLHDVLDLGAIEVPAMKVAN